MPPVDPVTVLRLSALPTKAPTPISLVPDPDTLAAMARELDLIDLRKVRLEGTLRPQGRRDWRLEADLGATVVQPCSVTLAPVTTRIDEPVLRQYVADFTLPEGPEVEMPEDDTIEPLPETLDLMALLTESLALALPPFPRAEGADFGQAVYAEPGTEPLTDEAAKPFAGLSALKRQLEE